MQLWFFREKLSCTQFCIFCLNFLFIANLLNKQQIINVHPAALRSLSVLISPYTYYLFTRKQVPLYFTMTCLQVLLKCLMTMVSMNFKEANFKRLIILHGMNIMNENKVLFLSLY